MSQRRPVPFFHGSGNIVTVSYGKLARTLDFTARPLEEKRLKLTLPQVLTFILGEEIDLSGLKVEIEYTDGSVREVTDYKISEIEPLNTEKRGQDVVVTSGMRTGTALFPCGTRVSFCAAPWDLKSFLLRSVSTVKG